MTREPEEPFLFDLPLSVPPPSAPSAGDSPRGETPPRRSSRRGARLESLPLFGEPEATSAPAASLSESEREPLQVAFAAMPVAAARGPVPVPRPLDRDAPMGDERATLTATPAAISLRLRATFGDLAIFACAGAVAAVGATMLGAELNVGSLPALLVFLLSFSFLYCVVSLAFWGQTPGMAWTGLVARSQETEPLSFGQTALRWLGHWLTWALLGLPGLLALSGRSLADRLSGSRTYESLDSGSTAA